MKEHLEIDLKSLLQDNDFKLLCCCSRRVLTSEDQQTITKLIQDNPNWNRFIDLAKRHRVVSLVHWNLRQVREIKIPEAVLTFFKNHAHKQVTRNLQATTSLLKILSRFQEHGIPVLPFKGPVLASILYNDVGLRYFGDLDILVNPATLNKACMTLKDIGL